jgi:arylsulfatase A-like enzyme/Tfp pilus assembly protein PilF
MVRRRLVRTIWFTLGLLIGNSFAFAASKPNLVLITLDSTRADRMGFLGAKGGLTPNLDRLTTDSLVFEHAYAQAPDTLVSHATILTGSYPQATGMSAIGGALAASAPYLPALLKAQGYRTAAFVGSIDLDPHNGPAQGFDRGFQTYDAGFRPGGGGTGASPVQTARSASQVAARAAVWLARNSRGPFFLWIHLNDPNAQGASYNTSVKASDAAVGKLLAALKQQKTDTNTAVLVVADHGESLGAHGEDTHGVFLYDETIHVPLLLKMPGAAPGKRVAAKVRLVDIAPTLLEIAAVPVPSQMQGQSLLRIAKGSGGDQPVYSRSDLPERGFGWSALESWRAGKYLYVRAPKPELYDLMADPGATRNLAQSAKATLDTLAGQLESFSRRVSGEASKSGSQLSSSEMQKLASLGYVGLQKGAGPSSAATGTDPKDKAATSDKVLDAVRALERGKPDRAIAALAPIVSAEPNVYLAEYTLGVALAQKGQHAEAVKHLHKVIELQSDSAWAHYYMGSSLLKTGDYKTAVVHLEIAAGRLPEFAPAHTALAEANQHLGRSSSSKQEHGKDK